MPDVEDAFEALLADLAAALRAGADPEPAMRAAISAFYDLRERHGEPRGEYAIHFFWVDGVGLARPHDPLWKRLRDLPADAVDGWAARFEALAPGVA